MSGTIDFVEMSPPGEMPLSAVALRLNARDNVAIAKTNLRQGTTLILDGDGRAQVAQFIASGHKVALRPIPQGEAIRRYGQIIGFASRDIAAGEHVHLH